MTPKKRLGEMLIDAGIIGEAQLRAALGHQRQWGVRIGQALVDLKLASEAEIVHALSVKFGFEVARLDALDPYALDQALKLVPREFALRHNVLPMAADSASITVAMSDPTNLAVVDEVRFRSGRRIKVCIGGDREIAEALRVHYPGEGAVEAIALDLDVDDDETEAVHDPFGGGSRDDLAAFFATPPTEPAQGAERVAVRAPARAPAPAPAPAPARRPPPAPPQAARGVQAPPQRAATPPRPAPAVAATPARPPPAERPSASAAAAQTRATALPPQRPATTAPPAARAAPLAAARPAQVRAASAPPPQPSLALLEDEITGGEPILATDLAPDDDPGAAPAGDATALLGALERLAAGAPADGETPSEGQVISALVRLLLRKGIVGERELLEELVRR